MNKAIELKNLDRHYVGRASLYRLNPPLDSYGESHEHVIISSSDFFEKETLIFPADGPDCTDPSSWGDIRGSKRGVYSHRAVLNDLGYEVEEIDV